jgi:predicted dehydrogenase
MKPIVTALCSFGMSGQVFHGPSLKVLPQYKIHKILERNHRISEKHYPQATIVNDFDKILHDPVIELVIINTPDYLHFEMAKMAMEAGKHVVVEKPFTKTSEEAVKLIEIAKHNDVLMTVYQNRRLDGGFQTVRKVLENKFLGRVVEFECHYDRYRNFIQEGSWKEDGDERTGVLFNLGPHIVDQALVLFGKPTTVTANLSVLRTGGRTTDQFHIRLQYDGFVATLRCSYLVREMGPQFIIHGTKGSFVKMGTDPQEEMLKLHRLPDEPDWGREPQSDWGKLNTSLNGTHFEGKIETIPGNYAQFYKDLYESIRNGAELMVKPEEALMTIRILEACLVSNKEQKTIPFI